MIAVYNKLKRKASPKTVTADPKNATTLSQICQSSRQKHHPKGQKRQMKKHELIQANLKAIKVKRNLSSSKIAVMSNQAEHSVSRFFSGETVDPGVILVGAVIDALGTTWADVTGETGDRPLAELQADVQRLAAENERLQQENAALRAMNTTLIHDNDTQRLEIQHKDELLAVHNYYLKRGSAHNAIRHKKPRRP